MGYQRQTSNEATSNANYEKGEVIAYANTMLVGLAGGAKRKISSGKLYDNNEVHNFIKENKDLLDQDNSVADGQIKLVVEIVFVDKQELAVAKPALAVSKKTPAKAKA